MAAGIAALALYLWTGASSVLSGDQAEHQFTAAIAGVPHATGYPLFTLLNAVAVRMLPFGDAAHRVTVAVALYSALAVALVFVAGRRLAGSALAGSLAAVSLALAPEWWSLATIADVYTLQALLLVALLLALLDWWRLEAGAPGDARRGWRHPLNRAALLIGLGITHHGSFVPIVLPALVLTSVPLVWRLRNAGERGPVLRLCLHTAAWGALGLVPWLYLAAQYALFRPFDFYRGQGLPYHYYWGNPASWADVFNLALGAGFRNKILTYGWERMPELALMFGRQLGRQVWWSGLALGAAGAGIVSRRHRRAGVFLALVFASAALFGMTVAADVPKAHVYGLPAFVVWSLWLGAGGAALWARLVPKSRLLAHGAVLVLLALIVWNGAARAGPVDRSGDWDYRRGADLVLDAVAPRAVVLCRWETCMTLRYLQLAEGRRLDVQLDQTEPEAGVRWSERAALYAPALPVYALGYNAELAARVEVVPVDGAPELWRIAGCESC